MSFTKSTNTKSPFATSTAFNQYGATSYNQSWISTAGTWVTATVKGKALAQTGITGGYGRLYFENNNYYEQSAAAFYASNQVFVASIDECLATGNSFKHLGINFGYVNTTQSRTNILRLGY
jgi:hypothetical protein